jgi:hypothetical protein
LSLYINVKIKQSVRNSEFAFEFTLKHAELLFYSESEGFVAKNGPETSTVYKCLCYRRLDIQIKLSCIAGN